MGALPSVKDPYATDRTTRVWVEINGVEFREVEDYEFDEDVLTVFDSFALTIGNPDGINTGKITPGASVRLYMADPAVGGGARIERLRGIVTRVRSTAKGGGKLMVQGADLGWHLANNDAPLWMRLSGATLGDLLDLAVFSKVRVGKVLREADNGWGFVGFEDSSLADHHLRQGRAGIERSILFRASQGGSFKQFIPPIQVETGNKIADFLIAYARRERKLVNVSAAGTLKIFAPDYNREPDYRIEFHVDERRSRNNVIDATLDQSIDGLYTDVTCVTQVVYPQKFKNNEDPNAEKIRGRYRNTGTLPFLRRASFSDSDQIGKAAADQRAKWFWQRGIFDSTTYTAEVQGHCQGRYFWQPDSIVAINDTFNRIEENWYLSACRTSRRHGNEAGTRTILTLHKRGFLAA